jgi:hypothetical protein
VVGYNDSITKGGKKNSSREEDQVGRQGAQEWKGQEGREEVRRGGREERQEDSMERVEETLSGEGGAVKTCSASVSAGARYKQGEKMAEAEQADMDEPSRETFQKDGGHHGGSGSDLRLRCGAADGHSSLGRPKAIWGAHHGGEEEQQESTAAESHIVMDAAREDAMRCWRARRAAEGRWPSAGRAGSGRQAMGGTSVGRRAQDRHCPVEGVSGGGIQCNGVGEHSYGVQAVSVGHGEGGWQDHARVVLGLGTSGRLATGGGDVGGPLGHKYLEPRGRGPLPPPSAHSGRFGNKFGGPRNFVSLEKSTLSGSRVPGEIRTPEWRRQILHMK